MATHNLRYRAAEPLGERALAEDHSRPLRGERDELGQKIGVRARGPRAREVLVAADDAEPPRPGARPERVLDPCWSRRRPRQRALEVVHVRARYDEDVEVPALPSVLGAAARALRDALPLPSSLPELDFPADSMGGRCLDAWRYRWGQRLGDLWLYVPLPAGTEAKDVRVDVHRARLSVEIRGVVLHAGALWNAGETHGVDVDAAAWVVVRHGCDRFERDATPVLQVELHKKKSAWWKAVWAGHPTIEPWEVPGWREATLGDGYHVSTCGDARLAVF